MFCCSGATSTERRDKLNACVALGGKTCTRMLVPEQHLEEVKALAQAAIAKFSIGPSLDEASRLGPLVTYHPACAARRHAGARGNSRQLFYALNSRLEQRK